LVKLEIGILKQKLADIRAEVRFGEPLHKHSTFKIGGNAAVFALPADTGAMLDIMGLCKDLNVPHMVLGRGSNILFPDGDLEMAIISTMRLNCIKRGYENPSGITACAGALLKDISDYALERGLTGFEFACGIPGTLGGALRMNAGAYGGDIAGVFGSALVMDAKGGTRRVFKDEMDFGYRRSAVSGQGLVVLEADLVLQRGEPEAIEAKMRGNMEARNRKQPVEKPSAGSAFKRPMDGVYAARLIEECGLKGFAIGGAQVSEKHSGFIINTGGASAGDVKALLNHVRDVVFNEKGITLEPEIIIVG